LVAQKWNFTSRCSPGRPGFGFYEVPLSGKDDGMNGTQFAWTTYSHAFRDAMWHIAQRRSKQDVLKALKRSREAIDKVLNYLSVERANKDADLARHVAVNIKERIVATEQEVSATW
jgi:hypothetical protein